MSDVIFGEGHDDPLEAALHRISLMVDGVVAQQCARHYSALTQEHQFTSGLARAIERELEDLPIIDGVRLEVLAQDFPDRGPHSLEKRSGSDLYISVVRRNGTEAVSKGILAQAKWDHALGRPAERRKLRTQARRMLERSHESYTLVYEPTGIGVVPALAAVDNPLLWPSIAVPTTVGQLVADGLRCTAGDPHIGRSLDLPPVEGLNAMLERLGTDTALSFAMETGSD
jgi:hypothetical protein